jgi:hypothetical protein
MSARMHNRTCEMQTWEGQVTFFVLSLWDERVILDGEPALAGWLGFELVWC